MAAQDPQRVGVAKPAWGGTCPLVPLAGHGMSVEVMPFLSAGSEEGKASSAHCSHVPSQWCPQLPTLWCSAPSWASASQGLGVQLQQSSIARAGNAPAMEDTEFPTHVAAAVKQICDISSGRALFDHHKELLASTA